MKKFIKRSFIPIIIFIVLIAGNIVFELFKGDELSYKKFENMVEKHEVKEAKYSRDKDKFEITDNKGNTYEVISPQTDDFKKYLLENNIKVKQDISILDVALDWIPTIFWLLIIISLLISMEKIVPGTDMEKTLKEKPNTKLSDISLPSSVKKEAETLIDYLNNRSIYIEKDIKIPNGILLYGPPGTGKTMFARAIAGEAGCSFYALSGSDFVEMYVGRGAARVRKLFKAAKDNSPAIIFIDEIDAIGTKRNTDNNSERDQTLNALLNELDGFDKRNNVLVIAATNRIEVLDPALIRPGRFGKHIAVPIPMTKNERMHIIKLHAKEEYFTEDVNLDKFAKITTGFSGADIASILNEARLIAVNENKEKADDDCIEKAFNQFITKGHEKDKDELQKDDEKRMVAIHEASHAIAAKLLCGNSVPMVSIIATTSGAGGYTISLPEDDISYYSKDMLYDRIKMMYAGRAGEMLKGYPISTGASNDMENATMLLKDMSLKYGMLDDTMVNYEIMYEGKIPDCIYDKMKKQSQQLFDEVSKFLKENEELLNRVSEVLIANETIDEEEFDAIIEEYQKGGYY